MHAMERTMLSTRSIANIFFIGNLLLFFAVIAAKDRMDYPLTAPIMMPVTKYRCRKG